MGYQSDLVNNKILQNNVNRHNDNYSSIDLNQDAILVSALISLFLQTTDFSDRELLPINVREICALIELKRRLHETKFKLEDLEFKQEILTRKLEGYTREDLTGVISNVLDLIAEYLTEEKIIELTEKIGDVVKSLPSKQD